MISCRTTRSTTPITARTIATARITTDPGISASKDRPTTRPSPRYARDSKRTEETNLYVDALLLGAWIAALGFPTWLLYAALFSTALNAMVLGGVYGVLWSAGCFAVGAAIWSGLGGLRHEPETSHADRAPATTPITRMWADRRNTVRTERRSKETFPFDVGRL